MTRRDRPRAGSLIPLNHWHDAKIAGLGSSGRDLLVMLLSWCADHLTDGSVPASSLRMLAATTDDPERAIEAVRRNGFVVMDADGNAQFPPSVYELYNLVADEVAMLKATRAAAGSIGGRRSAERAIRGTRGQFTPKTIQ